ELRDDLARALQDADPTVRRAAADAVGQAVQRSEGAARVRSALFAVLAVEPDSQVRGQLAENAGRVRADSADAAPTATALAAQLPLRGAVRGLFFLARQRAARGRLPAEVGRRLQEVAATATLPDDVRALVATAASIGDPAPVVRYRALALAPCAALAAATRDTNAHVALGAVDALARCGSDSAAVATL
ncbi:hypothetical protein PYV61_26455, partial [Roseisolibacter sp. H3M3-2]